ncbi:MAG: 2-oxoacid:acceptor oxidoreductase family protein, partial [Candidatus Lokiarchaeota archaeon]|nr:2-oxoacid:acceptor oxidoreductase family protein [Candidatus Lokiarchaeota archaeon]
PMIHQLGMEYPTIEEIQIFLKNVSLNIHFINANDLASQAGNLRTMNVVMLGVVSGSGQLPLNEENLLHAIMKFVPKKAQEVNKVAFNLGIEKGKSLGGK